MTQAIRKSCDAVCSCVLAVLLPSAAFGQTGDCVQESLSRSYRFRSVLPAQDAPSHGVVQAFVFGGLPALAWVPDAMPFLRVRVSGDLGLLDENLYVRIDGGTWTPLSFPLEGDCSVPAECRMIPIDPGLLAPGELRVEIVAGPGVSASVCPKGFTEVGLQYSAEYNHDCNANRRDDACEIVYGLIADCDGNLVPDDCQIAVLPSTDCNGNGRPDCCDFQDGASDIDSNGVLDACEIAANPALDCDRDGVLDRWEIYYLDAADIDRNAILDSCDIAAGRLADCDGDGVADLAELLGGSADLNGDYIVDGCTIPSVDLYPDGVVNSVDLALFLAFWQNASLNGDINRDGVLGGADLALLLSAWGLVTSFCGDGVADATENCCNCPQDVGCGEGFDCYYGVCVPCPSGQCPKPGADLCEVLTGSRPRFVYGGYGNVCVPDYGYGNFFCGYGESGFARHNGFSPSVISPELSRPTVAFASFGLLTLLIVPGRLLRRATLQSRR